MNSKPIPVYDLSEFERMLRASPDMLLAHPYVVRGFTEQWPAARTWIDLDYLARSFGHLPVSAGAPQFTTHKHSRMCQVRTTYGTYLRYLQQPERLEELFAGQWRKGDAAALREMNLPLYCGNLRLVRHAREPVFEELSPIVPAPLEYLNSDIPYYYQSHNHVWLYVSRAGALTPLHQDNNAVIAYLAQLKGRKHATLYSPADKPHFYNPAVGYLNPLAPNEAEFPSWRQAQPWTATLEPGELLIWGPNWAHHVVTESDSVTVSFDIVNSINLDEYTSSMDWRLGLGEFACQNADMIRSRIHEQRVHDALARGDEAEVGREVMLCVLRAALAGELSERSRRVKRDMLRVLELG